jgi:hypothetical protein
LTCPHRAITVLTYMNPLESYLTELRDIRRTGAAVAETSFYPALSSLFNEIGKGLKRF